MFIEAWSAGWHSNDDAWGLHFVNGAVDYLGVAQDHATPVFIGKFVMDRSGTWHGYPADHRRNQQDIPSETIQKQWLDGQVLPVPKLRKISKGQRCVL